MAYDFYHIKKSTLKDIADAVREVEKSTEDIPVVDLDDRIKAALKGAGASIPDDVIQANGDMYAVTDEEGNQTVFVRDENGQWSIAENVTLAAGYAEEGMIGEDDATSTFEEEEMEDIE